MDWQAEARRFLDQETQFRLGMLPTEQSHPKTRGLAETLQQDVSAGVRMLQAVDDDVAGCAIDVLSSREFGQLVTALTATLQGGGRICFSGCGSTGRLAILLEACWRRFWLDAAQRRPELRAVCEKMGDRVCSIMTGGDYALIRAVENFEDFMSFGRRQVKEAGLGSRDVLVAISEGGETSSVIGTIHEARDRGARTFFLFNNPPDILVGRIERSREVIEDPAVTILDLSSGPMAVTGSTRMQATTFELLVVGAALELSLVDGCRGVAPEVVPEGASTPEEYAAEFRTLLAGLAAPASVQAMVDWIAFERDLYERRGLVTYFADGCLLDIFTDTTERTPTFMLPPFRKCDDAVSPPSWAFVKSPMLSTPDAWRRVLGREPRCLDWDRDLYAQMGAAENVRRNPPVLDADELRKFLIGCEDDPSRYESEANAAILAVLGSELAAEPAAPPKAVVAFQRAARPFALRAGVVLGEERPDLHGLDQLFFLPCRIPRTPLDIWERLAVKLAFNTVSTATMGCVGRLVSNWMAHVDTTNKKLIDRGARLVAELAGVDYETACFALHETNQILAESVREGEERPSPVALTIQRLRA